MLMNLRLSFPPPAVAAAKKSLASNSFGLPLTLKIGFTRRTGIRNFAVKTVDHSNTGGIGSSITKQDVIRNTANFHPNIWGDQFLEYHEKEGHARDEKLVEELRQGVRKELLSTLNAPAQHMKLLELVDTIQRLGIAYYFEDEIDKALKLIYDRYGNDWIGDNSLYSTSLWFRLLRQQGYNVSSGIFDSFKNEKGDFMESLTDDVQGLLALYEAAYLRVRGEAVLDDALLFSTTHLQNIAKDPLRSNPSLATQIRKALEQPIWKRLPRIEALRFIPMYEQEASRNESLLKLAKLGFNLLQELHKKELSQLSKWWKSFDVPNSVPYARDRLVECYFWILTVYVEPQYSRARVFLTKLIAWASLIDDTYDAYGTREELEIFTEAIERWSITCLDELPQYMKILYQMAFDAYKEMEEILEKEGKAYRLKYSLDLLKDYMRSYMDEAIWANEGYVPTLEEYLSVGIVSNSYPYSIATSLVGMDDIVKEESFKWLSTVPPLVTASSVICRLRDDMSSHKMEQERKHVASCVECYMKQYGVPEEYACEMLYKQVDDAWIDINQECLRLPADVPMEAVGMRAVNLARATEHVHRSDDRDNYTRVGKELIDDINSYFVVPMSV